MSGQTFRENIEQEVRYVLDQQFGDEIESRLYVKLVPAVTDWVVERFGGDMASGEYLDSDPAEMDPTYRQFFLDRQARQGTQRTVESARRTLTNHQGCEATHGALMDEVTDLIGVVEKVQEAVSTGSVYPSINALAQRITDILA